MKNDSMVRATHARNAEPLQRTETFDAWLQVLKDAKGRAKIQVRIDRLGNGNPGDVGPIGVRLSAQAA